MEILRNKVIVVAAAESSAREPLAEEFRKNGSEVLVFDGGYDACEYVRARQVDALLCTPRLSTGNPAELLSDVRRLNPEIVVILFGGEGEAFSATEATHRGFSSYFLEKQPTPELMQAVVRSLAFVEERKRKKVERISVAAQVELSFGEPPAKVNAPVLNLSRGGLFLSLDRAFPQPMSMVDFRLSLGVDREVSGKALVRWVRDRAGNGHFPGVGIEFTEITEEGKRLISAHVERQSRAP